MLLPPLTKVLLPPPAPPGAQAATDQCHCPKMARLSWIVEQMSRSSHLRNGEKLFDKRMPHEVCGTLSENFYAQPPQVGT